jgi:hypothetical protein
LTDAAGGRRPAIAAASTASNVRALHRCLDLALPKRYFSAAMKAAYDELPGVPVSRMRASGVIGPETKTTTIAFGDVEFVVGLTQRRFPNGGSWSFFLCPCGRRARILRLYEGALACCRCLKARGLHARVELVKTERRAAWLTPKRLVRLKSDTPARLHPRPGRMLDRRANLELALKRSLIVARRANITQFEKDLGGK